MDSTVPPPVPPGYRKGPDYYATKGITFTEGSFTNSRGNRLFTTTWTPRDKDPKGIVFLCHGYGVDSSTYFQDTAEGIALGGYTVHGLDYQGHGQSEGLRGMIESVDSIVDDCIAHFGPIRDAAENEAKAKFLCGESMGGAIILKMHEREPTAWDGAVLLAPMCKISDKFKPHPVAVYVLSKLAYFYPTWAIVPTKDLADAANEDPEKREYFKDHPTIYHGKPRLGSAVALLNVSEDLERNLHKVSLPFLLLHGDADTVTDPGVSKALYEQASSSDKTFRLYPGMWHSLIQGAYNHNAETVLKDIVSWLDARQKQ